MREGLVTVCLPLIPGAVAQSNPVEEVDIRVTILGPDDKSDTKNIIVAFTLGDQGKEFVMYGYDLVAIGDRVRRHEQRLIL